MDNFLFSTALLDSMFPDNPKRNWNKYSEWVGTEKISSLPYIAELEQALNSVYSSPSEVGCECLDDNLIGKSNLNEFCLNAITDYFSQIPN